MSRRVLIALFFLFAITAAIPTPESTDSSSSEESGEKAKVQTVKEKSADSSSSESEEQVPNAHERNELFTFTLTAVSNISKFGVENGTTIVKGVLSDLNAVKSNNPVLQTKLVNFTTFLDESAALENSQEDISMSIMKVFIDFCDTIGNFSDVEEPTKTRNAEDALIILSLQKNGIEEFAEEIKKRVMTFSQEFSQKIEKYFSTLSAEERKKEKLYEWYNNQKKVSGFESLMEKFGDFFDYA